MNKFKSRSRRSQLLIVIALIYILLLMMGFIYQHWKDITFLISVGFDPRKLESILAKRNLLDFVILTIITGMMSAVPFFSSSVIGVVNGVLFGPYLGSLINIAGNTIGNLLVTFTLKRTKLKDKTKKLGNVVERLSRFENKAVGLWLGYTIPMMPSFLVNYTAIRLQVPLSIQFICILLGVAPTSILYALGGNEILKGNLQNLIILAILIIIPYSLYTFVYKKRVKSKKKE